ncbi:MAG: C25 family cysteine peptidase [Anaerolineales bacterium]
MHRPLRSLLYSFSLIGVLIGGSPVGAAPTFVGGPVTPSVTLLEDGVQFEWQAPLPTLFLTTEGAAQPTLAGFETLNTPNLPRVPFASVLVALPPDAKPDITVDFQNDDTLPLPASLARAPQPAGVQRDARGDVLGGAYAAALAEPFAPNVVELEEAGVARGVRLARVMFYPARPEGESLRVTTRVRATIRFNGTATFTQSTSDSLIDTIAAAVINPTQVQAAAAAGGAWGGSSPQNTGPRALIEVSQVGLTVITYEALSAAGFALAGINPVNVHLARAGVEVALEWEGDADASFEPGERFIFFASPRFNRYSTVDVYALTADGALGLRMSTQPASPNGLTAGNAWMEQSFESNALYMPECYCAPLPAGRDGDRWAWDVLRQPDRTALNFPFALPAVNTTQPATLTVWYIGYTDAAQAPDHRVSTWLNNTALGTSEWNGKQAITHTVNVPAGLLLNGNNSMRLTLPGIPNLLVEGTWLDAFSIRYARGSAASGNSALFTGEASQHAYTVNLAYSTGLRAYDVTDTAAPLRLTNLNGNSVGDPPASLPRRYALTNADGLLAPVRVRLATTPQTVSGARYLIITHPDFVAALGPLVSLRQAQGLSVVVENVQAIYDAGDGRATPDAIRAYIASAYAAWNPRPEYVLLVGDGTVDPKRYRADSFGTFIPPYLEVVDPWMGETAADNRYVTVDGNDALSDLLIGRLPVNAAAEIVAVVNKIVQYETAPPVGAWNARVTFISDDADAAGNFPQKSLALAGTHIAAPFYAPQIALAVPLTPTVQAVRGEWNGGAGALVYNGHSSIHQWTAERIFHLDDVAGLTNGGRLPIVLQMTCFTGSFHLSSLTGLDEALLRQASGGAAAVWGPTGLGVATGHDALASGYLGRVYGNGQPEIGAATLAGKLALATANLAPDLIDTFTLFGDPAMRTALTIDPGFPLYLPIVRR